MTDKGKKQSLVPGLILIGIGIVAVLNNFEIFEIEWESVWTYIILLLGVIFWLGFILDRSKEGLIMPGTVLLTYGVIFNISSRYGWYNMEDLWPFFILGPAFGFYAMYLFGKRDHGIIVPAVVLTIIGTVFLLGRDAKINYIWPPIIVVIGIIMLIRGSKKDPGDGMQ